MVLSRNALLLAAFVLAPLALSLPTGQTSQSQEVGSYLSHYSTLPALIKRSPQESEEEQEQEENEQPPVQEKPKRIRRKPGDPPTTRGPKLGEWNSEWNTRSFAGMTQQDKQKAGRHIIANLENAKRLRGFVFPKHANDLVNYARMQDKKPKIDWKDSPLNPVSKNHRLTGQFFLPGEDGHRATYDLPQAAAQAHAAEQRQSLSYVLNTPSPPESGI